MAQGYLSTDPSAGLPAQQGYLSTDPNAGLPAQSGYISTDPSAGLPAQQGYLSTDPNAGSAPQSPSKPSLLDKAVDVTGRVASSFGDEALKQISSILSMVAHPIDTAKGLVTLPSRLPDLYMADAAKRQALFDESRGWPLPNRIIRGVEAAVPVLGPLAAEMEKDIPKALGQSLAFVTGAKALEAIPTAARLGTGMRAANPAVDRAVTWLREQGVNVPLGVASDKAALRGMQEIADKSTVTGSIIADKAAEQARQALTGLTDTMAGQIAKVPVSELGAGRAVLSRLSSLPEKLKATAQRNYDEFDRLVSGAKTETRSLRPGQPFQSMQAPVDLRRVKSALKGELNKYQASVERISSAGINPQHAAAMRQIDTIVNEMGDFAPVAEVERAVSELKRLQRGTNNYNANAVISRAVWEMDSRVLKAARAIDPKAEAALVKARAAWKQMIATDEQVERLVSGLRDEPGRMVSRLTAGDKQAVTFLREVQTLAPQEMRQVGRAYFDAAMEKVRASGFQNADALLRDFRKLGTESKRILFADAIKADPAFLSNLDNLLVGMSRMAKQFNPSGSGHAVAIAAHGGISGVGAAAGAALGGVSGAAEGFAASLAATALGDYAAGKLFSGLMRNPTFVKLMVEGLNPKLTRFTSASAQVARDSALAKLWTEAMRTEAGAAATVAGNTSASTQKQ